MMKKLDLLLRHNLLDPRTPGYFIAQIRLRFYHQQSLVNGAERRPTSQDSFLTCGEMSQMQSKWSMNVSQTRRKQNTSFNTLITGFNR
jgi:hypothetical protein